jgi:hypothetical protein
MRACVASCSGESVLGHCFFHTPTVPELRREARELQGGCDTFVQNYGPRLEATPSRAPYHVCPEARGRTTV